MDDTVIRARNLSKQYRIGTSEGYKTFREMLVDTARTPFRRIRSALNNGRRTNQADSSNQGNLFWALKDVSFEVKQGEVVGVIGRNGAGKTTLLKILSRITDPTEGRVELHGRVGSLLEVGTGFHPELTGHENIYLYGAILGMDRWEVTRKFDEIVAFAELDAFVDTPVKRYSSGMYMRLAFAVAAHLEPEILLVDEVLAVGDAAFQKKCLGKMDDVAKGGRTVLFVSHQMHSIRKLCEQCICLEAGRLKTAGPTVKVVSAYESSISGAEFENDRRIENEHSPARFLSWEIVHPKPENPNLLITLKSVTLKIVVQVNKPIRNGHHGIALWDNDGQLIWAWATENFRMKTGTNHFVYKLPSLPIRPGVYHWQVSLYENGALLDNWYCMPELIVATQPHGHPRDEWNGIINLPCAFRIEPQE